jgi:alpha-galactosidase
VLYRVHNAAGGWDSCPPSTAVSADVAPAYPGGPVVVKAGADNTVTTTLTNYGRVPAENPTLQLTAPDGWTVTQTSTPSAGAVPSGSSRTVTWNVRPPANTAPGSYALTATATFQWDDGTKQGSTSGTTQVLVPNPPPSGTAYVSDVQWTNATNGWGPPERDRSNGETGASDGNPITIGGVTYTKGVGAHAPSEIDVYVGGRCSSFSSDVGVDDEKTAFGSVVFQVWADNTKVADSGLLTVDDPAKSLTADLRGAQFLRMVVTDGGDGNNSDHADWAAAQVTCS